ncbi:MAG: DinB family protein [Planctomycetota bacterium]|nr:DinB family protein [Planctomycetota bacterium]
MAPGVPWVERAWAFDFPAALHPQILERLRGTPARLEDLLRGLASNVLTRREGESWSIQENAGHLIDTEFLPWMRLDELLARAEVLSAADMSNRKSDEADHNARDLGQLLAELRTERARLVARFESLEPIDFELSARHPRLERTMRVVDLCLFHAEHDDHHLARITELKRRFGAA